MIPGRRLRVIDGVLLVATLAVAMGIHRAYWSAIGFDPFGPRRSTRSLFGELIGVAIFYQAILAAVLVLVQSPPPRRPRAELATLPGFMACLALFCATAATVALSPFSTVVTFSAVPPTRILLMQAVSRCAPAACLAVSACWLTLAFGRNWRPEPTWTDRLGRAIGIWAVVSYPAWMVSRAVVSYLDPLTPIVPM